MRLGQLAVVAVALGLALGGFVAGLERRPASTDEPPIRLRDDVGAREDETDDETRVVEKTRSGEDEGTADSDPPRPRAAGVAGERPNTRASSSPEVAPAGLPPPRPRVAAAASPQAPASPPPAPPRVVSRDTDDGAPTDGSRARPPQPPPPPAAAPLVTPVVDDDTAGGPAATWSDDAERDDLGEDD